MIECSCGRPRATDEDYTRWNHETAGTLSWGAPSAMQESTRKLGNSVWTHRADPEWAKALCWTPIMLDCRLRRRWASGRHIDEARRVFELYVCVADDDTGISRDIEPRAMLGADMAGGLTWTATSDPRSRH